MKITYIILAIVSLTLPFLVPELIFATELSFPEFANENPQLFFAELIIVSVILFSFFLFLGLRKLTK